ncbi:MAG: hypothetical protein FRX49_10189 [Trebouxia sp. A1-2]|nr:MAG: hypothetical protein FRX49_10189 [Trebouxia sp. A1-2]
MFCTGLQHTGGENVKQCRQDMAKWYPLTFIGLRLTDLDLRLFLVDEYSLECLRASMAVFKLFTKAQFWMALFGKRMPPAAGPLPDGPASPEEPPAAASSLLSARVSFLAGL